MVGLMDKVQRVDIYIFQPLDAGGGEAVLRHMLHIMTGDVALIRADAADRYGNLSFRYAQMNFGPVMATAAKLAVAEVRQVLDEPMPLEHVQLPGVYVDRVVAVAG